MTTTPRRRRHDLLGATAVADHLCITTRTLTRWRKRYRDIPIYQRGKTIRANSTQLDQWLEHDR